MLKKANFKQLLERITVDQLEECYGGQLSSRSTCWPPVNTLHPSLYTIEKKLSITQKIEELQVKKVESKVSGDAKADHPERNSYHHAVEERANSPGKSDDTPNSAQKTDQGKPIEDHSPLKKTGATVEKTREQQEIHKVESAGLHHVENEGNNEEGHEFGGQALLEDKGKKVRNVNSKPEEPGSESLREANQEKSQSPTLKQKSKKPRVSFRGDLNDLGRKKEEPQIQLESHGTKVEFCGFCAPSDKKSTGSCAIF
jgi:hypothetical protein